MRFWKEIFAKFLLDAAKIVLTTIILGKFVMPELIGYITFWLSVIIFIALILFSKFIAKGVDLQ